MDDECLIKPTVSMQRYKKSVRFWLIKKHNWDKERTDKFISENMDSLQLMRDGFYKPKETAKIIAGLP